MTHESTAYQFAGTGYKMQCEAYGIVDAAKIVAACCNSEIWDSYDLIAKAVANKRFADMWLFFSLHVFCRIILMVDLADHVDAFFFY